MTRKQAQGLATLVISCLGLASLPARPVARSGNLVGRMELHDREVVFAREVEVFVFELNWQVVVEAIVLDLQ